MLIRSINTMALFIMMPDNAIMPRIVKKPNDDLATKSPITTPINPNGIVTIMMTGLRNELNCETSNNKIIIKAIGSLSPIDDAASSDSRLSPPTSNVTPEGQLRLALVISGSNSSVTSAAENPGLSCVLSDSVLIRSRLSITPG